MKKEEFISELKKRLSGLPQKDLDERLSFYGEMIDDRMEEGLSEDDAIAKIGSIDDIVSQIIAETPLTRIVKEKIRPKRNLRAGEITLIVLGFPLWFPLLITVVAVLLSIYIAVLAVLVSLWAAEFSLFAAANIGVVLAAVKFLSGFTLTGVATAGAVLVIAGLSAFAFYGCIAASKGILFLTKKALHGVKTTFVKKEIAK